MCGNAHPLFFCAEGSSELIENGHLNGFRCLRLPPSLMIVWACYTVHFWTQNFFLCYIAVNKVQFYSLSKKISCWEVFGRENFGCYMGLTCGKMNVVINQTTSFALINSLWKLHFKCISECSLNSIRFHRKLSVVHYSIFTDVHLFDAPPPCVCTHISPHPTLSRSDLGAVYRAPGVTHFAIAVRILHFPL